MFFISCLDSHSDGTHKKSLLGNYVMQNFSKFTPKIETNPTASRKAQGWVTFKQIFSVGSTIPVKRTTE